MFQLNKNRIVPDPNILTIPEFTKIWNQDRSRGKARAIEILSFVYHMCDTRSPYFNYDDATREKKLRKEFGIKQMTPEIKAALEKYREMKETPTIKFLKSAKSTLEKFTKYMQENELDEKNYRLFSEILERGEKFITSYNKLLKKAEEETAGQTKIRGGGKIGLREDPSTRT